VPSTSIIDGVSVQVGLLIHSSELQKVQREEVRGIVVAVMEKEKMPVYGCKI
jgi:hypothetical protein